MSAKAAVHSTVLTVLLLAACAQPPTAELQAAEAALAAAKEAGVAEYLPSLLEGAQDALDQADEAIEAGRNEEARGFLAETTRLANEGISGLDAAKGEVRDQVEERLEELDVEMGRVEAAIAGLESCLGAQDGEVNLDTAQVRVRLDAISGDLGRVRSTMEAGDYLVGLEGADVATEELFRIRDEVAEATVGAGC